MRNAEFKGPSRSQLDPISATAAKSRPLCSHGISDRPYTPAKMLREAAVHHSEATCTPGRPEASRARAGALSAAVIRNDAQYCIPNTRGGFPHLRLFHHG